MSRLQEVIQEYCPDGVEYKQLKDIAVQYKGMSGVSHKWEDSGNCKFIDYLNAYNNLKINVDDRPFATVKKLQQNSIKRYDILLTSASETPDECALSSVVEAPIESNTFLDDHLFGIRFNDLSIVNPVFINYYLHTSEFRIKANKAVRGVTRFYITPDTFMKLKVPVPPMLVQQEIVKILDSFSKLEQELEQELEQRKKQYVYYRNLLLSNPENATACTLGDVCKFVRGPFGGSLKKEIFKLSGYAVYEQQNAIYQNLKFRYFIDKDKYISLKRFSVKPGDLIVSCSGTIGKTFIIPKEAPQGVINQALLKLTPYPQIDVEYLQFFFENTIEFTLNNDARGGAIKNVPSVKELQAIPILVPPLEIQKELVEKLRSFKTYCTDLSSGLPAEISLRKKQYEYYRDSLLSFPRKA